MAPSTFHHQGALPGSANSSPSSHSLDIDSSLQVQSTSKTSILQPTGIEPPRTSQAPRFPIEVQLSFSSALEKGSVAPFLLERIRNFREGNKQGIPTTGVVRRVRQKDYEELNDLLRKDPELEKYASRQLKVLYNFKRRRLSYDMPGPVHETVLDKVAGMITEQVKAIARRWKLPDVDGKHQNNLVDQIDSRGQTAIDHNDSDTQTEPDRNWLFTGGKIDRSCFILEISNSQRYKDIRDKVENLISQTGGFPGMALIIWVNYNEPSATKTDKTAWFTTIGACDERQSDGSILRQVGPIEKKRLIQDSSGKVEDGAVSFTIKDMLGVANEPLYTERRNSNDPTIAAYTAAILDSKIEVPFADIAEFIKDGEKTESSKREVRNNPDLKVKPLPIKEHDSSSSSSDSSGPSSEPEQNDPSDKAFKGKNPQGSGEGVRRRSQRLAKAEEVPAQTLGKRERSDSNESNDST